MLDIKFNFKVVLVFKTIEKKTDRISLHFSFFLKRLCRFIEKKNDGSHRKYNSFFSLKIVKTKQQNDRYFEETLGVFILT